MGGKCFATTSFIPITTIEKIDNALFERKRQSHLGSFLTTPNAFKKYFLSNSDTAYVRELYSDLSIKQVRLAGQLIAKLQNVLDCVKAQAFMVI